MSFARAFIVSFTVASIIVLATAASAPLAEEPESMGPPVPAPPAPAPPDMTTALKNELPDEAVMRVVLAPSLPGTLTSKDRKGLQRIAKELQKGKVNEARMLWATAVEEISQAAGPLDFDAILNWVLREAYIDANESLRAPSNKVRFYEEMRRRVREHVEAYRETLTAMQGEAEVEIRTISIRSKYKRKKNPVRERGEEKMSDAELAEYIRMWEDQLAGIGQDAALAGIDLQEALQKQQQLVNTMSSVSKLLHDTAMGVIRKVG